MLTGPVDGRLDHDHDDDHHRPRDILPRPGLRGRLDVDAAVTQWTSTNRARLGVDCRAGAGTGQPESGPL